MCDVCIVVCNTRLGVICIEFSNNWYTFKPRVVKIINPKVSFLALIAYKIIRSSFLFLVYYLV